MVGGGWLADVVVRWRCLFQAEKKLEKSAAAECTGSQSPKSAFAIRSVTMSRV